jgi:hypothetical protein
MTESMDEDVTELAAAVERCLGRTIAEATLGYHPGEPPGQSLRLLFEGGGELHLYDELRLCCESRFMTCDDDLPSIRGGRLVGVSVRDGGSRAEEDDLYEDVRFLVVRTTRGDVTVATHNRHNGYYGGFELRARAVLPSAEGGRR